MAIAPGYASDGQTAFHPGGRGCNKQAHGPHRLAPSQETLMSKSFPPRTRSVAAALLAACGLALALPATAAQAGTCPAGQAATDADHGRMTEPRGVTDTVIASLDVAKEPIAIDGRLFRLRRLEIQPGGVVPWHSHAERPAIIYVQSGEVTEYSSLCKTPLVHRAGEATPELSGAAHWWKNSGQTPAVLLSADLLKLGEDAKAM
jgi:quercetin dioxygenase-like cupin family protein